MAAPKEVPSKWGQVRSFAALAQELEAKVARFPNPANATVGRRLVVRAKGKRGTTSCNGARGHDLEELLGRGPGPRAVARVRVQTCPSPCPGIIPAGEWGILRRHGARVSVVTGVDEGAAEPKEVGPAIAEPDMATVLSALRSARGNVKQAAQTLGISRQHLYRMLDEAEDVDLTKLRGGDDIAPR